VFDTKSSTTGAGTWFSEINTFDLHKTIGAFIVFRTFKANLKIPKEVIRTTNAFSLNSTKLICTD
jgi:hypothetical protein